MDSAASRTAGTDLLLLDGGLGTQLEANGCDIGGRLWSAELLRKRPDEIRKVHRQFLQAGADVIAAASYQASIPGFLNAGLSRSEAESLLRLAVQLACQARDQFWSQHASEDRQRPMVAASIGPYGAFLSDGSEYRGNYDLRPQELEDFHQDRWHLLAEAGPDVMFAETIPSRVEANVLARLAEQTPHLPTWISFSCRDGRRIGDGNLLADCACDLEGYEAVRVVGVNCVAPELVLELIGHLRSVSSKRIAVYPNSGETYDIDSQSWRGDAQLDDFASAAREWYAAGATLVGGCCRTTPDHIAAMRKVLC